MEQLEESEIIGLIMTSLEGAEVAKIVSIAFFALFVYEWMITLADEIEYFWTGPWNLSRILFFIVRLPRAPVLPPESNISTQITTRTAMSPRSS
ncbi:hypothetical protein VKT23_006311 [Stygiomarasmius scandens]|uniref:DUF6533 domain-containing protein n=1 Tax=Marasmiellus scandens TaxID=2682957 RepID=A0ABR1JPY0_9AGAR